MAKSNHNTQDQRRKKEKPLSETLTHPAGEIEATKNTTHNTTQHNTQTKQKKCAKQAKAEEKPMLETLTPQCLTSVIFNPTTTDIEGQHPT